LGINLAGNNGVLEKDIKESIGALLDLGCGNPYRYSDDIAGH